MTIQYSFTAGLDVNNCASVIQLKYEKTVNFFILLNMKNKFKLPYLTQIPQRPRVFNNFSRRQKKKFTTHSSGVSACNR